MPQLVKKRRSGWAVLAAGALVASLLAVGAGPAAALDEDSKPDAEAATSACVGDATDDHMFDDVSEGHYFRGDINCLAYYGVTIGYSDGTFRPNDGVSNEEMVLFMGRAADVAGADADDVVGDFAETGSDPVNRGDMALLIARLLEAATDKVSTGDDGTFAVEGVTGDDWDYFADSRRSQDRVSDSAASALYELGVAKGTGMGYFSPASTVSRGAMAAFITRALAHTSARPEGVTIQSHASGQVTVSVRDDNFHPVANAPVDIFSIASDKAGDAFNEDGSCNASRLTKEGGNDKVCEIDLLDAPTNLDGDYLTPVAVAEGGSTVWAWTGDSGDKVEDGAEGLASIDITASAPTVTADSAKVTTDIAKGVTRVHFGSTVTVTIQLVGGADDRDAGPDDGGNSYTVTILRDSDIDTEEDGSTPAVDDSDASSKTTEVREVDATGKATFTITAVDPDPDDRNNPDGDSSASPVVPNTIDRVRVTFTVAAATGGRAVDDSISSTASGSQTITFSDARGKLAGGTITPTVDFLTRPENGSAGNAVTVTVVDQYGHPIRGHLVRLSSTHDPSGDRESKFPVALRTGNEGSVRIGYTYTGAGSTEMLVANTSVTTAGTEALTAITGATANFYWAAPAAGPAVASGAVVAADLERNTLVVANSAGPQLVVYDDNDQFSVEGTDQPGLTSMAAFEEALGKDESNNDTVEVSSYDPADSGDTARFVLTVVADT